MDTGFWTLVEHSRYVFGEDTTFRRAVEPMPLGSPDSAERIRTAGGLVLTSRAEAEQRARAENFPSDARCMLACVRGEFVPPYLEGRRLYQPARGTRAEGLRPAP
ncbi:MAG: hypothetical protein L0027_06850 [Candidatus Rokubacteria bacterium]|nr:hypothetical protein [Candidatus Rokubacteria bacterium]